jgi:predicted lipoprotein with Yx(FWY)xxD motif
MKSPFLPTLAFSLAALACGSALAAPPVKMSGGMLVDSAGMTLYTFDNDAAGSGKSACNGPCAANWPPVMADAGAQPEGDMTLVTRDDGTKQWAYQGKPVYRYKSDTKPGDATGDNFRNVWHAVKP